MTEERRCRTRFPLRLDVRFTTAGATEGRGRTMDISSTGVLFLTTAALQPSTAIVLRIAWPVRLDGAKPLVLYCTGRVTRTAGACVAVALDKAELRTCAEGAFGFGVVNDIAASTCTESRIRGRSDVRLPNAGEDRA